MANGQITTAKLERGYFEIRALSFLHHSALVTPRAFDEFRELVERNRWRHAVRAQPRDDIAH